MRTLSRPERPPRQQYEYDRRVVINLLLLAFATVVLGYCMNAYYSTRVSDDIRHVNTTVDRNHQTGVANNQLLVCIYDHEASCPAPAILSK